MVGEARVVVVSVGEPPVPLVAELRRRGLRVAECGFADAEEEIENIEADLVVLHGSRGAMELTTLLDDPERAIRPRLAIVAGGRELSRLWGLNRDIVVSLLAAEMSVRVIAERLEALAKQWARPHRSTTTETPTPIGKPPEAQPQSPPADLAALLSLSPHFDPPQGSPQPATEENRPLPEAPPPPAPGDHPGSAPLRGPDEPVASEAEAIESIPPDDLEAESIESIPPDDLEAESIPPDAKEAEAIESIPPGDLEAEAILPDASEAEGTQGTEGAPPDASEATEAAPSDPLQTPIVPPAASTPETTSVEEIPATPPAPERTRSPRRKLGWGLAALAAAGAAVFFSRGTLSGSKPSPQGPSVQRSAPPLPTNSPAPGREAPADEASAAAEADADASAGLAPPEPEAPRPADTDNPFRIEDAKLPGCEVLAAELVPQTNNPPGEASVAWGAARQAIMKGDLEAANLKMCQAVTLHPESAALEGLALLYVTRGSPEEALKWVERAESVRPGQLETRNLLGDIHSQLGDSERALEVWLSALGIPADDLARRQMVAREDGIVARRHLKQGDLPRADRLLRRAVTLDPSNALALASLGELCLKQSRAACARTFAERSIALFEANPDAYLVLGDAALLVGNRDEARKNYERALRVRPDFWAATLKLRELASP